MAVVQQLEPYIYHSRWDGFATKDHLIEGTRARIMLADSTGDPYYVMIFDLRHTTITTFDIRSTGRAAQAHPSVLTFLLVGAPFLAQVAEDIVVSVSATPVEHFTTLEDAVERARVIVATSLVWPGHNH